MYDTVLVPTDGSDHAVRAAEHGRYLAGLFDATVHLLHVVDVETTTGLLGGEPPDDLLADLEEEGRRVLETTRTGLSGVDEVETVVRRGDPVETILEYAAERDVGLLAMGTHGRTGLDRYVTGSVTERVVRRADAPVLTVRATDRSHVEGYEEVLVPTDGSDAAEAAVDHGLAVAERAGARVHAVNVVDVGSLGASSGNVPPTRLVDRLEADGRAASERVAARARERGLEVVTEVTEGFPAVELLDYTEERDVDLCVMGTAGRTGLNRYLLGSTTERIVRHAEVPVLAVNARTQGAD